MTLPTPVLDDRTFEQLVAEARTRIPQYTPEWTNLNDSDPGMTLVKVHAWLTETILYRLNKLPDLNYLKFLELLNVRPRPAAAAQAQLTFTLQPLEKPDDPLMVLIPKNSQIEVDDPDLEEELIFETDRTLTALNAELSQIIIPESTNESSAGLNNVVKRDPNTDQPIIEFPFYPFGKSPTQDTIFWLGIILRPQRMLEKVDQENEVDPYRFDSFPAGQLDLTVFVPQIFEQNAEKEQIIEPDIETSLFPWEVTAQAEQIVWEAYFGTNHDEDFLKKDDEDFWVPLATVDETAALTRSGHIYLDVPSGMPNITFDELSREFWDPLGRNKPPATVEEFIEDLNGDFLNLEKLADLSLWDDIPNEEDTPTPTRDNLINLLKESTPNILEITTIIQEQQESITPRLNSITPATWSDAGYSEPPTRHRSHRISWFRARVVTDIEEPPQISQILLNTVPATAAVTRVEEIVGESQGRPHETFSVSRTPLFIDPQTERPDLELDVIENGLDQNETWTAVDDFFGATRDAPLYTVDSESGEIRFGDGVHGRIPTAGSQIIVRRYRYGGGAVGNAGPGTITTLRSALPQVNSITNVRAAAGGREAEPLSEVILRAPHSLRTRDRAVTADDFADLAKETPGVPIQRAFALANKGLDGTKKLQDKDGAVTVVILPENREETPQPKEDQLRLVGDYLDDRRLITTELYVTGPRYLKIASFKAEVTVDQRADLKSVYDALMQRLQTYFHPLRGGEDGRGWPFGQNIFFGNVYRQMLSVPGVLRVLCLEIAPEESGSGNPMSDEQCSDMVRVPDEMLVHVPHSIIDLKVSYEQFS